MKILFVFVFLLVAVFIFIKIAMKIRKGGGSKLVLNSGAMDACYTSDKKKAVEMVVEINACKKMEEQTSGEPDHKSEA
ncbi:MAG: hypothetical protein ACE5I1_04320 [bacterium]